MSAHQRQGTVTIANTIFTVTLDIDADGDATIADLRAARTRIAHGYEFDTALAYELMHGKETLAEYLVRTVMEFGERVAA